MSCKIETNGLSVNIFEGVLLHPDDVGGLCAPCVAYPHRRGHDSHRRGPHGRRHHHRFLAAHRLVREPRQWRVRRTQPADRSGGLQVIKTRHLLAAAGLTAVTGLALAADAVGAAQKQPLNLTAIGMFFAFVVATLGITYWAASKTKTTADFYTAGGGISGFQNGLAIAGDYMSAATLLGLSALTFAKGLDGFLYAIGFFVGWPVILFLMAERLRNLGKFTFADIASYRLDQSRIRTFAAFGSLTVVCFYLIVQMEIGRASCRERV